MSLRSKLTKVAHKLTPRGLVLHFLNKLIQGYGRIIQYHINQKEKKLYLEFHLSGDSEKMEIWVDSYEIISEEGSKKIRINQVRGSREWVNKALNQFAKGKTLPVPEEYEDLVLEHFG
jgi:hypothetical protein